MLARPQPDGAKNSVGPTLTLILFACLANVFSAASAEASPRSVLILEQWDAGLPWYEAWLSAFRLTMRAGSSEQISVFTESLDLGRFHGPLYHENMRRYLEQKYGGRKIDVIVPVGPSALEFIVGVRADLWPGAPVIFAAVDQTTAGRLQLPGDVAGSVVQLTLGDMASTARALMPDLERIALVGEALGPESVYRHFKEELPGLAAKLDVIDLTGLAIAAVRKRVATLHERTVILYTSIFADDEGGAYDPREVLAKIAEVANRPIVISSETQVGYGGVGGLVVMPGLVGDSAARLVLRLLNGESAASLGVTTGRFAKPVFDGRQLRRWNIGEDRLPPGSEIRFRELGLWARHGPQVVAVSAIVAVQGAIIFALILERRRRAAAQVDSRRHLAEVAQLNRSAVVGALSAAVGHEINQPLGAILANTRRPSC